MGVLFHYHYDLGCCHEIDFMSEMNDLYLFVRPNYIAGGRLLLIFANELVLSIILGLPHNEMLIKCAL